MVAVLALVLAACGGTDQADSDPVDDDATTAEDDEQQDAADAEPSAPDITVVATTSILGDIVGELVGDDGEVVVLMPPGVDPHGYQPSAADAAAMRDADLVVANGLQLEENLVSALEAAEEEGVPVVPIAEELDPIPFEWDGPGHSHGGGGHSHEDDGHSHEDDGHSHEDDGHSHEDDGHSHEDDGHSHEDDGHSHDDDHGHSHGEFDPHVWQDPVRMADGVQLIADALAEFSDADAAVLQERADAYTEQLLAVHEEIEELYASIPADRRQLVTNHDALGYLADRYDFEVIGTVIPGSTTQVETDPQQFARLVETVEAAGVSAVFAENTDSTVLAEQLQSELVGRGDVTIEVVRIYTDALGEPGSGAETYLGLLQTNAELITDALS